MDDEDFPMNNFGQLLDATHSNKMVTLWKEWVFIFCLEILIFSIIIRIKKNGLTRSVKKSISRNIKPSEDDQKSIKKEHLLQEDPIICKYEKERKTYYHLGGYYSAR